MAANLKGAKAQSNDSAAPVARKEQLFKVMLGLQTKRYVLVDKVTQVGTTYETAIKYSVTAAERDKLFRLHDEDGVRVFYDAQVVENQLRAKNSKARAQRAAAGDEDARLAIEQDRLNHGEIDTGATALRDENGDEVGVTA